MKRITDPSFKYKPSHDTDITLSKGWKDAHEKMKAEQKKREELRKRIAQLPTIGRKSHG